MAWAYIDLMESYQEGQVSNKRKMGDWAVDTIYDLARNNGNKQYHQEFTMSTTAPGLPIDQSPRIGTRVFTKDIGFEHGLG